MKNFFLDKILFLTLLFLATIAQAHAVYVVVDDDPVPVTSPPIAAPTPQKEPIRFVRNTARLLKQDKKKLVELANSIQPNAEVKILARNDSDKNTKLGDKRLFVLRTLLMRQGIQSSLIKTVVDDEKISNSEFPHSEILVIPPTQSITKVALPSQVIPAPISPLTNNMATKKAALANLVANGVITSSQADLILERAIEAALIQNAANTNKDAKFEILEADRTLQNTLNRWAVSTNWKIVWKDVVPILNPRGKEAIFINKNSFIDAADRVLQAANVALNRSGIQLSVSSHPNNVLVVSQK